jgi:hypothetical protein
MNADAVMYADIAAARTANPPAARCAAVGPLLQRGQAHFHPFAQAHFAPFAKGGQGGFAFDVPPRTHDAGCRP